MCWCVVDVTELHFGQGLGSSCTWEYQNTPTSIHRTVTLVLFYSNSIQSNFILLVTVVYPISGAEFARAEFAHELTAICVCSACLELVGCV